MNNLNILVNKKISNEEIERIIKNNDNIKIINFLESNFSNIEDENLIRIFKYLLNFNFNYFFKNLLIVKIQEIKETHPKTWDLIAKFYY